MSAVQVPRTTATIVALGDSTTAGTPGFRSPLESPPDGAGNVQSQYAYWLAAARPSWRVLNRGINGQRTDQIAARFERDVVNVRPDAVIIIAGVNDVYQGRGVDAVTAALEDMYERARNAALPVVAGSIIPFNTATADHNARMRAVNEWIRAYAIRVPGVTFSDTRAAAADPGAPDRLVSSPDNLHPSPDGYRRMAAALEPAILHALSWKRTRDGGRGQGTDIAVS